MSDKARWAMIGSGEKAHWFSAGGRLSFCCRGGSVRPLVPGSLPCRECLKVLWGQLEGSRRAHIPVTSEDE